MCGLTAYGSTNENANALEARKSSIDRQMIADIELLDNFGVVERHQATSVFAQRRVHDIVDVFTANELGLWERAYRKVPATIQNTVRAVKLLLH